MIYGVLVLEEQPRSLSRSQAESAGSLLFDKSNKPDNNSGPVSVEFRSIRYPDAFVLYRIN